MDLRIRQLHPMVVGKATGMDLSADLPEASIAEITVAIDRHAMKRGRPFDEPQSRDLHWITTRDAALTLARAR
jgi:hypothetical protein